MLGLRVENGRDQYFGRIVDKSFDATRNAAGFPQRLTSVDDRNRREIVRRWRRRRRPFERSRVPGIAAGARAAQKAPYQIEQEERHRDVNDDIAH